MFKKTLLALSVLVAPVQAAEVPPAMSQYIYGDLMRWINDPRIVEAVNAQNRQTASLTEAEILERDAAWRAQLGTSSTDLIDRVINAPLSDFLRAHLQQSGGRITEVFVMDAKGLNVAASAVTSDYWQGDEAKFLETVPKGAGSVFVDEIEFDESTQTYQGQVSFAVTDPDSGQVVGAITVGLNAGSFL